MTEKKINTPEIENEEVGIEINEIQRAIICTLFAIGSFWAYFNGYVVAIKRLSLGEYSFLVVGILFTLGALYSFYEYAQSKKEEKEIKD